MTAFALPFPSAAPALFALRKFPSEKPSGVSAPRRRKSRRARPSQCAWTLLLIGTSNMLPPPLVIEDEFLRVQQRPQEVAGDFRPLGAVRQHARDRLLLGLARTASQHRQEQRLDHLPIVGLVLEQLRQAPLGVLDLLDHARP